MIMKDLKEWENKVVETRIKLEKVENELAASNVVAYNFIPLNPWLVKFIGFDAAALLSTVYEKYTYLSQKGKVKSDSITLSINDVKLVTGMGEDRQKKAIAVLKSLGLLDCSYSGLIPKRRVLTIIFNRFKAFEKDLKDFMDLEITKSAKAKDIFRENMDHIKDEWIDKTLERQQLERAKQDLEKPRPTFNGFSF